MIKSSILCCKIKGRALNCKLFTFLVGYHRDNKAKSHSDWLYAFFLCSALSKDSDNRRAYRW